MNAVSTESPLAGLIAILKQGRDTFTYASQKTGDGLKVLFTALSEQNQQFVEDLASLEEATPEDKFEAQAGGDAEATLAACPVYPDHYAVDEGTIVKVCVRTECDAVQQYEEILQQAELAPRTGRIVRRQLDSLKTARNYLRGLGLSSTADILRHQV